METHLTISFPESVLSYTKQHDALLKQHILNNLPGIKQHLLESDIVLTYEFEAEAKNKVDINFEVLKVLRFSFSIPTLAIIGSVIAKNLKAIAPIIELVLQYKLKKNEPKEIIIKHEPSESTLIIPVTKKNLSQKDVTTLLTTFLENIEKSKLPSAGPDDNFTIEV